MKVGRVAGLLRLRYVFAGYTHRCMNLNLYVSHMFETFMGFSLHVTGLSKRRALPKAVEFNALNKQRL